MKMVRTVFLILVWTVSMATWTPTMAQQGQQQHRGQQGQHGMGQGQGQGQQHRHRGGQDQAHQADQEIFHFLLDNRSEITRNIEDLENGVKTLTESENPAVAEKIREHVRSMYSRLEGGNPIHMRDPLFAAIFQNAEKVTLKFEETGKGMQVTETSSDSEVVKLIQAHARVVSKFLANGRDEVRKNHSVEEELAQ